MNVGEVMTTRVVTVSMDDNLTEIQRIFNNVRFHHLLVINGDELVGVISDRDLLKYISPFAGTLSELPRDLTTMKKRAHQIMTRRPVTIGKAASIESAVHLMLDENVSCLPVVDVENRILGVLSWKDLLRAYQDTMS